MENMSLVSLSSHVINISLQLSLGLFQLTKLSIELFNGALGFRKSGLELHLGHFNIFSLGKTLLLILAPPHIRLLGSLAYLSKDIVLATAFLLKLLLDAIQFMFKVLEFAKQRLAFLGLIISNTLGLIQLRGKLRLNLNKHISIVLKLLQLSQEISIFCSHFPFAIFKITKSKVSFFNLLVDIIELGHQVLVGLLSRSLGPANLINGSTDILNLMHDLVLILFNLGLHLAELINLL